MPEHSVFLSKTRKQKVIRHTFVVDVNRSALLSNRVDAIYNTKKNYKSQRQTTSHFIFFFFTIGFGRASPLVLRRWLACNDVDDDDNDDDVACIDDELLEVDASATAAVSNDVDEVDDDYDGLLDSDDGWALASVVELVVVDIDAMFDIDGCVDGPERATSLGHAPRCRSKIMRKKKTN